MFAKWIHKNILIPIFIKALERASARRGKAFVALLNEFGLRRESTSADEVAGLIAGAVIARWAMWVGVILIMTVGFFLQASWSTAFGAALVQASWSTAVEFATPRRGLMIARRAVGIAP